MLSISATILLGVISGIATSFFIFGLSQIFNKILLPWYQDLIYSGFDISGDWYCIDSPMAQNITLELNQKARRVTGLATYVSKYEESSSRYEQVRTFEIRWTSDEGRDCIL